MAPTDIGQKLDEALVAILRADAGIQQLAERTEKLVRPWGEFGGSALPVILYQRVTLEEVGALGDTRRAFYDFTAVAEGEGGRAMVNALIERVEIAITQPALAARGMDAAPMGIWRRRPLGVREQISGDNTKERVAEQLEAQFLVTK